MPKKIFSWQSFIVIALCIVIYVGVYVTFYKDNRSVSIGYDSNGNLIETRGDFDKNGNAIGTHSRYYNGEIHTEVTYDERGNFHGSHKWYKKDKVYRVISYNHGKRQGAMKEWDTAGNLILHYVYENDSILEKIKEPAY